MGDTILVTGGAGYVGSHLTRMLLDKGYNVRILDSFIYGDASLAGLRDHPGLELQHGDICNPADLARGVDLFVVECSFPEEEAMASHLTPSSAGRLAQRAGPKRLLLTPFYPAMDPEAARRGAARFFDGPIELARDGARFCVSQAAP